MKHFLGKTVLGTLIAVVGHLTDPAVQGAIAMLPSHTAAIVTQGVGVVVAVIGLRDAISKNGNGK